MLLNPIYNDAVVELSQLLMRRHFHCVVAESCTGGLFGAILTSIPGSSNWFYGGIIAYDNRVKNQMCGVSQEILDSCGAVSQSAVRAMASGVCQRFQAECGIAISGIAGPGGATAEKPVGLVYIAIHILTVTTVFEHHFSGDRDTIRSLTVKYSLEHAITALTPPIQITSEHLA
ncbi:MAG: CinA family protein [Chitinivibrionales bacterium]|nr:CinA family protein [Chitinivibrionales bacterium]